MRGDVSSPHSERPDAGVSNNGQARIVSRRMLDHVSALTLAQVFYRIVSLGVSLVLARYLGIIEQGAYMLVMNFVAVFGSFSDLGIANLVIRDMNQQDQNPSDLVGSYLSLLTVVNLALLLISIAWAMLIGYEFRLVAGIMLAGLGSLFVGTTAAYYSVLAGRERMKRVALIQVLNTLVIAAGMGLVMLAGGTLIPLTAVAAVSGGISLMLHRMSALKLLPDVRLTFNTKRAFTLLLRGLPFTLHVGLYVILTRVDVLFVKRLSDPYTLGVYTAATRLTYPMTLLSMMTAVAIFPIVSRYVFEHVSMAHEIVRKAMIRLGLTGLGIALVVMFGADHLVRLLFGAPFRDAAPVLAIAIWYIPIFYLYQVVSDLLVASNKVWGIVWITLACLVLNIVLNIILIPRFGAHGAAWTTVACEAVRCMSILLFARWTIGFPLKDRR